MSESQELDLYNKFEKYFGYYNKNLPEDGRAVLREAAEKICADEKLSAEAVEIKTRLADTCCDFKPEIEFKDKLPQFGVFVYTLATEDMEKLYKEKNISHDILIDTIQDMYVWINFYHEWYGEWGGLECGWLVNHIRGRVIRLGRLQFERSIVSEETELVVDGKVLLKKGDPFLNVHIPEGSKLTESACLDSFERAKEFFPKVLNYDFKAFGCFTWLFDPEFEKLLPAESNILKFQKLFTMLENCGGETDEALRRVFVNITRENIRDAQTDTYFRRTLKEYVQSGGKLRSGAGYRLI
ncbi:MAG: acyltransferase domain-containing protein [Oscillospiraceae bacterium]|nr:acyltransferase domain-containing protein [Oscillospiraceae bacterium]